MAHSHGHPGGHPGHGGHHQPVPHHPEPHHQPPSVPHHQPPPVPHHHHPHGLPVPLVIPVTDTYLPTTVGTPLLVDSRPVPPGTLLGLFTCIGCLVLIVVLIILWF